jgi:hypothetical protein
MIEATIKNVFGSASLYKSIIGARVSLLEMDEYGSVSRGRCIRIGCIIQPRKNSRPRKGKYEGKHICGAVLENIVSDGYEED